ncbi:MAG: alpha/beta hydrolase [Actinobacteria bacterium]|nr:alpha/beta hydrolase [Actinomycetota bacterium]
MSRAGMFWRPAPLLLAVSVVLAACAGASSTTSPGTQPESTARAAAVGGTALRQQLVDVEGRKVSISCQGDAPKTVLFVSDIGQDGAAGWGKSKVPDGLLDQASVCVYDRPGLGASEPATSERSITNQSQELSAVIKAANLPAPVYLVAQGYGTIIARKFASDPRAVAGLVLVDPPLWGLDLQLPGSASDGVKAEYDYLPQLNKDLGLYGAGALPPPPAPTLVLGVDGTKPALPDSADPPFAPTTTTFPLPDPEKRRDDQKQLAQKSPFGRFEYLESAGSYAQYWDPEGTVAAIKKVLANSSR